MPWPYLTQGIVLAANPSYLSLYGYSHEQIIGKSFAIIFAEEKREQAVELYKIVFSSEVIPAAYESVVLRADGTKRIVEANPTFLTDGGQRTAMLSTIRDITERKRYEQELLRLNETLEAACKSARQHFRSARCNCARWLRD